MLYPYNVNRFHYGTRTKVADHWRNVRGTGVFGGAQRVRTVRTGSSVLDKTSVPVRGRFEPGLLLAARRRLRDVCENAAAISRERIALHYHSIVVQGDSLVIAMLVYKIF